MVAFGLYIHSSLFYSMNYITVATQYHFIAVFSLSSFSQVLFWVPVRVLWLGGCCFFRGRGG